MAKKLDPKVAERVMLKAGLKPLEPYRNSKTSWKCKCMKCKKIVSPKFSGIKQGKGGCIHCGYEARVMPTKYLEKEAVLIMMKVGLKPLVPYKNSHFAWKCRCLKCHKIVSPQLNRVLQGTGCRFCANESRSEMQKIPSKIAIAIMLKAKLQPLEPYSGSGKPWKCKCLVCGKNVNPRVDSIKAGQGGCKPCGNIKSGNSNRMLEKDAVAIMLKAKLKPMEPYVNSKKRWKCQCMKCGMAVEPSLGQIQTGGGGCVSCGSVTSAGKRRMPESEAIKIMINSGYKPLEPYKNNLTPWKSKCLKCGKIVQPTLSSIQRGQGGCGYCARTIVDPKVARKFMISKGYEPQVPYTTSHAKWECIHIPCGNPVSPAYAQIQQGAGGCWNCAPFGINMENPSYLYLITHVGFGAHKVGIGNHKKKKDRLGRFQKEGWETHKVWQTKTGAEALEIEKGVLKILRKDMKLPIYLSKEDMPKTEGHTETVNADSITLLELEKIINRVIKGYRQ